MDGEFNEYWFDEYQRLARETAVYEKKDGLSYVALGLAGEAGEIANKVKKIIRDHNGKLSEETRKDLIEECGDLLWYLSAMAQELGIGFGSVATLNILKLRDRKNRGAIHGKGDNR